LVHILLLFNRTKQPVFIREENRDTSHLFFREGKREVLQKNLLSADVYH